MQNLFTLRGPRLVASSIVRPMKLALWQTAGYPANVAANLAALERTAAAAAAAGAALLLAPECWLCGYNIGAAVARLAERRDGPAARRVAEIARHNGIAIVYGYAERDPEASRIYNAAQAIGPDGTSIGHYRKTHLWGAEERAAFEPGSRFEPPFLLGDLTIGLLVCYDIEFPEPARSLALEGADVILVPTALTDEYACVPDFIVPARSVENQLYVAYCNHCGVENGMRFLGGSCLTGMDGKVLAGAGSGEALIVAEVSREARDAAARLFPHRSDRRPELYGRVAATLPD